MQSRRSDAAGTRAVVLLACVVASFLGGAGEARAQDAGGQAYDCVVKPSLIVKLVHRFIRMVQVGARRDTALRVDLVNHLFASVH